MARILTFPCLCEKPAKHGEIGGLRLLSARWSGCFLLGIFPISIINFINTMCYTNIYIISCNLFRLSSMVIGMATASLIVTLEKNLLGLFNNQMVLIFQRGLFCFYIINTLLLQEDLNIIAPCPYFEMFYFTDSKIKFLSEIIINIHVILKPRKYPLGVWYHFAILLQPNRNENMLSRISQLLRKE